MQSLKLVSEDQRRRLFEFGEGLWKVAKYLEIKEDSVIGNHYHKLKDECFLLLDGEMEVKIDGERMMVRPPAVIDIPRGTHHTFYPSAGVRLVCLCSETFNKDDDYL